MKAAQDILRWIVVGAVFLLPIVPFIVADGLFFPYITGKNFAFRIIVELMAGAWLALAFVMPQYRPRSSWVLSAFGIFVCIIGFADLFGAYAGKSMWSNFERMEGWVTLAHLLVYMAVAVSVLNTENLWRRLFQWSLALSLVIAFIGFLQAAGMTGVAAGFSSAQRIDATVFGNPIYLAAYMLFHVFLAALLWMQMVRQRPESEHFWPGLFYCAAIGADTLALFMTGTRGAMLGLVGGALLTLLLLSFGPGARRWRVVAIGFFAGIVVLAAALIVARDTAFIQNIGFLNRLSSISLTDSTTKARFFNMSMAWQGVKERPILGWGQENYAIVFDKYYDPRMYAQEQWFDRVHNSIFDWWIAGGTLGLLAFLSVFLAALWVLWRSIFGYGGSTAAFTHEERSVLTGLLAAYFLHNLTVFDNITSSILFATVLGYIAYREVAATGVLPVFNTSFVPYRMLPLVSIACGIFALVSVWSINSSAYAANKALIQAMQGQQGGVEENLRLFEKAISYQSLGTQEAREQLAQVSLSILASDQVPADMKVRFVQLAISELDKQSAASPLDARHPLFAAGILSAAGLYEDAVVYYQKAHELSPGKQTILYQMGQNALALGDGEAGLKYFKEAYELEKSNLTAATYLAYMYYSTGKKNDAISVLEEVARINREKEGETKKLIDDIKNGTLRL